LEGRSESLEFDGVGEGLVPDMDGVCDECAVIFDEFVGKQ
jgi:hypothetical protein